MSLNDHKIAPHPHLQLDGNITSNFCTPSAKFSNRDRPPLLTVAKVSLKG